MSAPPGPPPAAPHAASPAAVSPVRLEGALEPSLSRWLWLVKWLLVLPHVLVLALLWVAFAVTSLVAFFAILITARYPRALFDFGVGVLRWSWRVSFYSYGALGTDRYPPFTLSDDPKYPARFDVAYPERLSRGLVLVKSWLLVLPHAALVTLFATGTLHGGGVVGLLVFFAGVSLLFTGGYPPGIFPLVLGLQRWVMRVAAYTALMTDVYPPFRLDQGGSEPVTVPGV
ncbi:DUF4389 domain-containing protein [Streptomyces sp. NPDC048172]|uniref:DUF4389 domain-containing protein n=1 Tax=Streptomyces sp. NPDC048172 TaxID=3365505 RepID=UPI003724943D